MKQYVLDIILLIHVVMIYLYCYMHANTA